jgi:hypothetical protein
MFVKLLALLISNVLVSFSVLWCYRSLQSNCGLKDDFSKEEVRLSLRDAIERMPRLPMKPTLP